MNHEITKTKLKKGQPQVNVETTINIKEFAFLISKSQEVASKIFKQVCERMDIKYTRGMALSLASLEKYTGYKLAKRIEEINITFMKHRETKSKLLNDLKCIEKGDFAGRFSPLKKFLAPPNQDVVLQNWHAKQVMLANQTSLA